MKSEDAQFRCGSIALVGRPNVGKSTLLNALMGQKLSITSRKPQTTRHRIRGILSRPQAQFVFVDTPGFQTRHMNALNRRMNRGVQGATHDVDVIALVVEAGRFGPEDRTVLKQVPAGKPLLLVVNKTDTSSPDAMLPFLREIAKEATFDAIVPVSAQKKRGLERLLAAIQSHLPVQAAMFADDELTDRSERFLAAELLREKLFRSLGDEVPYGASVMIEKFETLPKLCRIHAAIVVDKAGHKGIVIGNNGEQMKRMATAARKDMETLFGRKVYLEVWVKVRSGWTDDEAQLGRLGYD
jgi:GTP-binding protein Era